MKNWIQITALCASMVMGQGENGESQNNLPLDANEQSVAAAGESTSHQTEEKLSDLKGSLESLNESYIETKATVDKLSKIKISGYGQVQGRYALDRGIVDANNPSLQSQFQVRRGRLKVTYDNGLKGKYVMQLQAGETGLSIKDMHVIVKEFWLHSFALQAGIQDIPFGYEIGHSGSVMETMERSRLENNIFNGEKELGMMLSFAHPNFDYINAKLGLFNGTSAISAENDDPKALIGRVGLNYPLYDLNMALSGGVSLYQSKSTSLNDTYYMVSDTGTGTSVVKTDGMLKELDRNAFGFDFQYTYDVPYLGGLILRGEYTFGEWVGNSGDMRVYNPSAKNVVILDSATISKVIIAKANSKEVDVAATKTNFAKAYVRKYAGYYLTLVQNIGLSNQFVVRYDTFDPNTELEGDAIGGANSSKADLEYNTLGLGWNHFFNENIRISLYYDKPTNETSNHAKMASAKAWDNFSKDISDDLVTFRIQYKF